MDFVFSLFFLFSSALVVELIRIEGLVDSAVFGPLGCLKEL